jgi:protein TonB
MDIQQKLRTYFERDLNKTLTISVLLHIILMATFIYVGVGFDFAAPDFAEISFVSGEPLQTGSPPPGAAPRERAETPPAAPVPEEQAAEPEPVKLPQRRMLEDEEPQLQIRDVEKKTAADASARIADKKEAAIAEDRSQLPITGERSRGEKIAPGASRISMAEKEVPRSGIGTGGETDLPFKIEGEASQRSILHKVIPQYPPGLQNEAIIKVQFTVLPDGSVGKMVPVIKGNTTLESITLNALRQWRFNPLQSNAPQREVEGIITFRYILK